MTSLLQKRLLNHLTEHNDGRLPKRPRLTLPLLSGSPLSGSNNVLQTINTKPPATVIYAVVDSPPPVSPTFRNSERVAGLSDNKVRKKITSPCFLGPQLSLGGPSDDFQAAAPSSNKWPRLANQKKQTVEIGLQEKTLDSSNSNTVAPQFIGNYEIVREADDSPQLLQDQRKAYVVKEIGISNNIGLCRCISYDKYLQYVELYRRFTSPLPGNNLLEQDYSEDEVMQRIWPKQCKLFAARDEATREMRHYVFTPLHFGSLHVHVVDRKKLSARQALLLYRQIVEAAAFCHARGVVLRDVKLRKFVFADEKHERVRFFDLDEFHVLPDPDDDTMRERNGCPAYVSPEIIDFQSRSYAGKPADMWGLGVLLYVMLVGRYPFYDITPLGLFTKIRSAQFGVPNSAADVPYDLRCIVRFLLRKEPKERLTAWQLLRLLCLKFFDHESTCYKVNNPGPTLMETADDDSTHVVPSLEPKFKLMTNNKFPGQQSQEQEFDFDF